MEQWGYLDSGFHHAAVNMALDEALLIWQSKGLIPPTLRLYGWSTPTLSIGHFQRTDGIVNWTGLHKHGCELVRRLTGGSAVLHDNELTYSIVIPEAHPSIPTSIREAYYVLSKGVLEGYKNLGIHASYATEPSTKQHTAVCFEKKSYYEMVVDGKKISGNAQTRKRRTLLQHGSIPISMDDQLLFDLFMFDSEEVRQKKRMAFKHKATTINQIKGETYEFEQVKQAFLTGFQTGLNISLRPFNLTEKQWNEVQQIATDKYQTKIPIKQ